MYQSKEKIQTVVLLLADLICFVVSYFGGGYLWLVLYRNVSVQNMKSELMDRCLPRRVLLYRRDESGAVFRGACGDQILLIEYLPQQAWDEPVVSCHHDRPREGYAGGDRECKRLGTSSDRHCDH